jgi:hypothetical protein
MQKIPAREVSTERKTFGKADLESSLKEISRKFMFFVNVKDFGAVSDGVTDNTDLINDVINNKITAPNIVYIPNNTKWDYTQINHPNEIQILDHSTYDWKDDSWTGQIKTLVKTSDPSTKNAHEQILFSDWHPAFLVDNTGGTEERRASFIIRQNGTSMWRVGKGIYDDDDHFLISKFPEGTTMFSIDYDNLNIGLGGQPENDISLAQRSRFDNDIITFRTGADTGKHSLQFKNESNVLLARIEVSSDTDGRGFNFTNKAGSRIAEITDKGEVKAKEGISGGSFTTTERNNLSNVSTGISVFDTSLGKPIWYNGSDWVDASGNSV